MRIEVGFKEGVVDALGEGIRRRVKEDLGIGVDSVRTVDVYEIDKGLTEGQLSVLERELFADPIIQVASHTRPLAKNFDWVIEVAYQPGVTDTVGKTSATAIENILGTGFASGEGVYTSKQYAISGNLARRELEKIARDLLANDLVQLWVITDNSSFLQGKHNVPSRRVSLSHKPAVEYFDLGAMSDEELVGLSAQRKLALDLREMQAVRDYFNRTDVAEKRKGVGLDYKATDVELEAIAQTWSEHCKHKIFNALIKYDGRVINSLFKTFIREPTAELVKTRPWIKSIFWDNSGVREFDKEYDFCFKCETHNSPSNEEPYGGAITGIDGVYRDPMGTDRGAIIIYGTYGFCTGNPFYNRDLKPRLHPKRLLEGVRHGVQDGGNKSGVPTPYGITYFHDGYMGKPAIFVLAAGLIPRHGKPLIKKKCSSRDLIVMIGGRIGRDGIHGATESSMEAGEWITKGHVQMGDPFTQKKEHDFLIEARELDLYEGITDNGAGGLSSSVGEMAKSSNGFELHIERAPLKYQGLDPWQIWVSESQERMSLAVKQEKIAQFLELAKKHDVEATVLGKFNNKGYYHVVYEGKTVAYVDMDFIHEGVPQMELEAGWIPPEARGLREPKLEEIVDKASFLREMLARPNIASKEYIVRQFDHEVQGTSVIKHLVGKDSDTNSDAVVIAPRLGKKKGIAMSAGINPAYGQIDTYHMSAMGLNEAIMRIIAIGGSLEQITLNDNFCWPSPLPSSENTDAKYKLAQLIRANEALSHYTRMFGTPCISGKDSMSMDGTIKNKDGKEHRVSALPTLQYSASCIIDDVTKCITMDVKAAGDLVYVLGETRDMLGGSEYYEMLGEVGLNVPKVDEEKATRLYNALTQAIQEGFVESAHGSYKGGLGVALAQTAFAGGHGVEISLADVPSKLTSDDKILCSESPSRFVVTVAPENRAGFEQIMQGNVFAQVGHVLETEDFRVYGLNRTLTIEDKIQRLKGAWKSTFKDF